MAMCACMIDQCKQSQKLKEVAISQQSYGGSFLENECAQHQPEHQCNKGQGWKESKGLHML